MTGDDHGDGGMAAAFDIYRSESPAGCSVDDWECVRATGYVYVGPTLHRRAGRRSTTTSGFEVGAARQHQLRQLDAEPRTRASSPTSSPTFDADVSRASRSPSTNRNALHRVERLEHRTPEVELAARHPARHELLLLARRAGSRTAPACSPAPACRCASPSSTAR